MRFIHDTLAQRMVMGTGTAVEMVADEVERLGGEPAMLIHGGSGRELADQLDVSIDVALRWDEVRQHVPEELARRARASVADAGVRIIVCVGGGSAIGLAKAIALEHAVRIVAVPTTYAGSEATPVWGLTADGMKTTGHNQRVLPSVVIYDAELTMNLPVELTVTSGLNALAHCVDALWAPHADPINLAIGLEGARSLARGLSAVVERPHDIAGREDCLYGAYLSAVAFASAGSGMHHKICHVLGGAYDLPHAPTHAVVLPHVLAYNADAVPDAASRLAQALGMSSASAKSAPAQSAVDALEDLRTRLSAPRTLAEIGLAEQVLPDATRKCLAHIPDSNPVPVTEASLGGLLHAAWAGDAPALTQPRS